jgi:hypothetical protein
VNRVLAKPGVLTWRHGAALVLACAAAFVGLDCSGAQDVSQVKHAAIVTGCAAAESEAGAAGDVADVKAGCEASLRMWEKK